MFSKAAPIANLPPLAPISQSYWTCVLYAIRIRAKSSKTLVRLGEFCATCGDRTGPLYQLQVFFPIIHIIHLPVSKTIKLG